MSVSVTEQVSYAVWGGDGAPYPFGLWFVNVGDLTAGDGTGGSHRVFAEFTPFTQANRNSNFYSLEQLTINGTTATPILGELQARNLGFQPTRNNTQMNQLWACNTVAHDFGGTSLLLREGKNLKILLGRQTDLLTFSGLRLQTDNVDMRTITMAAMGYVWSPRAISMPGGPRRPENGFWN